MAGFVAHRAPDLLRGNVFRTYAPQLVVVVIVVVMVVVVVVAALVVAVPPTGRTQLLVVPPRTQSTCASDSIPSMGLILEHPRL